MITTLNNLTFVLKPLILKTFTKDGLTDAEMETYVRLLDLFRVDLNDFDEYIESNVFSIDDTMEEIEEKLNSVVME